MERSRLTAIFTRNITTPHKKLSVEDGKSKSSSLVEIVQIDLFYVISADS